MNVQDLIRHLERIEDKTLQVRLECDHGQSAMVPTWISVEAIEDISQWMGDTLHPDDIEEGVHYDKVLLIRA